MRDEIKDILNIACDRGGGSVLYDEMLSRHSSIFIGGKVSAWYEPSCS